jgi:Protein-L-isoaspartate(D-aspartate) O-methyltransferase (PCMT)
VLAHLCREVYSIEIVEPLGRQAAERLRRLGHSNVRVRIGDGYGGWPAAAPFDAIIVTAAPEHLPEKLVEQLRVGGTMVVPVGVGVQSLVRLRKTPQGVERENLLPVRSREIRPLSPIEEAIPAKTEGVIPATEKVIPAQAGIQPSPPRQKRSFPRKRESNRHLRDRKGHSRVRKGHSRVSGNPALTPAQLEKVIPA